VDVSVGGQGGGEELEWLLIDVTKLPLPELMVSDDTALATSLRRLKAEMARPEEIIAAFSSYL
jgi:FXSXX-COOH protein